MNDPASYIAFFFLCISLELGKKYIRQKSLFMEAPNLKETNSLLHYLKIGYFSTVCLSI